MTLAQLQALAAVVELGSLTAAAERLSEVLRQWRRDMALAMDTPAFVVLPDSALQAIAAVRPKSHAELARVPGIGDAKLAHFGDALLEVVRSH